MVDQDNNGLFSVTFFSFGYKYGPPGHANLLYDVRFLPNPYWVEKLRPKTGLESDIADYVLLSGEGRIFFTKLLPLLEFLFAAYPKAGKKELHLGIGCTGGRHRSVAVVEALAAHFSKQSFAVQTYHRDIDKDSNSLPK